VGIDDPDAADDGEEDFALGDLRETYHHSLTRPPSKLLPTCATAIRGPSS